MRCVVGSGSPYLAVGLERVLGDNFPVDIVAVASAPEDVLTQVQRLRPDVVIAAFEPADVAAKVVRMVQPCPVLVLTWSPRASDLVRAVQAGARGVLPKDVAPNELFQALMTIAAGHLVLPSGGERALLDRAGTAGLPRRRRDDTVPFTTRELQVLQMIVDGASNKEIARVLGIALQTVKNHAQNVLAKAQVSSRSQLSAWALRRGLVSASPFEDVDR